MSNPTGSLPVGLPAVPCPGCDCLVDPAEPRCTTCGRHLRHSVSWLAVLIVCMLLGGLLAPIFLPALTDPLPAPPFGRGGPRPAGPLPGR